MSTRDRLGRARGRLDRLLETMKHGRADDVQYLARVELAERNIKSWAPDTPPPANLGPKGGSSTESETDERAQVDAAARQAARDAARFPEIVRELDRLTFELVEMTIRNVEELHPSAHPNADVVGCVSCARRGEKRSVPIGGHFAPAMPAADVEVEGKKVKGNATAARLKLCRWCYDVAKAALDEANERREGAPLPDSKLLDYLPPVEACDIRHRESPTAAGRWLARQEQLDERRRASA